MKITMSSLKAGLLGGLDLLVVSSVSSSSYRMGIKEARDFVGDFLEEITEGVPTMTAADLGMREEGGWEKGTPRCEVCGRFCRYDSPLDSLLVASMPGIPYSAAYCRECFAADAHPLHILAANAAIMGGLSNCAGWYKEMVSHTLTHLGKTQEEFDKEVAEAKARIDSYNPDEE